MWITSGLKNVLGAPTNGVAEGAKGVEGAETVEKLVERLQNSTMLDDRRGACRALRSLSKKYRVEVGVQGMDALMNVLSLDRIDPEIVTFALECLLNITSPDVLEDESADMSHMGTQFTEILMKKNENIVVLLSVLDEYDFRIRLPAIRVMTNLLMNKPRDMQDILLVSPMGIPKLMDLLSDSREVIRNDALLLLAALTKSNANIQKIIAFENGFDRIIQIIEAEGFSDGGLVVEDSLLLFLNLLRNNTSNQTLFREGGYIKKLLPFFTHPEDDESGWPTQKVSNVYHMLQVVRTLVSPSNPAQVTLSCQKHIKSCGILQSLCKILMANGIPAETLTEAIVTVAECMRGCAENQEYFASVMAPSDPPRPVLIILLMTLVNERQTLVLRCAVLYCVQSYLHKNPNIQAEVVKTLLPSATEAITVSTGQILCSGLFSKEPTSNWLASTVLIHALYGNVAQKDNALRVQLATKANSPPITLIDHLLNTAYQTTKIHIKLGFLQLLAIWLESCPAAITQFLSNKHSISCLIANITAPDAEDKEIFVKGISAFVFGLCIHFNPDTVESYTKERLTQLVSNRIGVDTLQDALSHVSKSELYLQSLKHPQTNAKHSSDLIFDHSFCILFKKFETLIITQLTSPQEQHPPPQNNLSQEMSKLGITTNSQSSNDVINSYKEVIRSQDQVLAESKAEVQNLQIQNAEYRTKMEELVAEVYQLRSQLALVQAQTANYQVRQIPEDQHLAALYSKDLQINQLQEQITFMSQNHIPPQAAGNSALQEEVISKLEDENKQLVEELERLRKSEEERQRALEEADKLKKDQEELFELLTEQENRISSMKKRLRELGDPVEDDDDDFDGAGIEDGDVECNLDDEDGLN